MGLGFRFLIFRVLGFTDGFNIGVFFLSHLFFNFITFFNYTYMIFWLVINDEVNLTIHHGGEPKYCSYIVTK